MVNITITLLKKSDYPESFALVGSWAISRQIHLHLFWCSIGKNSIGLSAIQKIFINLQVLSSHGSASS